MKKLIVLAFVAILATGVMAQDMDANWYVGTLNGDSLTVGIDKDILLPVWFQGGENVWIGDICYPIACSTNVATAWLPAVSSYNYWPWITGQFGWSPKEFGNLNDDSNPTLPNDPGYISMSFLSFCRQVPQTPPPDYLHSVVPIHVLDYALHTVNNEDLIGQTVCCLQDGQDPQQDPSPNIGDTTGSNPYNWFSQYACLFFSPNAGPTFGDMDGASGCGFCYGDLIFTVTDPDGDPVDVTGYISGVTTTGDPATADVEFVLVSTEYNDDAATYTYYYKYCGDYEIKDATLYVTATDNINDPVAMEYGGGTLDALGTDGVVHAYLTDMLGSTDLYLEPGQDDWVYVHVGACDCFCIGGFTFTLEWDPTVFSVVPNSVEWLIDGDYRNVSMNVAGPGTMRFTYARELPDQDPMPELCADQLDAVVRFKLLLAVNDYPSDFCMPICFMYDMPGEDHFDFNNVADAGGYNVWMNDGCDDPPDSSDYNTLLLDMACMNGKILSIHNVVVGDVNANGYPFEVGDVVLFANHLIDPATYDFTLRQLWATDVNGDGLFATIGDLIMMINILNGSGMAKVVPSNMLATVTIPNVYEGSLPVSVVSNANVGGAVVTINHPGVELGVPTADGMDLKYSDNGDVMTVVVYNMQSLSFAPGTSSLFTVPVLSEGSVSLGDVSVADGRGALLDARTAIEAPLPTEFSVNQNFPNPFNAQTGIKFALPTAANTSVNIYNVAGQLVKTFDLGQIGAGYHQVVWDASNVASGVYFYKVTANDYTKTMKMTLLK